MFVNTEIVPIEVENYWKSIQLYIRKPHVINRRLAGIVEIICFELIEPISNTTNVHKQISQQISALITESNTLTDKINEFLTINCNLNIKKTKDFQINQSNQNGFIIVNKLLAKNLKIHNSCYELIILDFSSKLVTFIGFDINICDNNDENISTTNGIPCSSAIPSFTVSHKENSVKIFHTLELENIINPANLNTTWLINCFKPKILKWCHNLADDLIIGGKESLSILNDIEGYNLLYNQLKNKYGLDMVEKWPEKTDASKFVYEDVAIATYLLMLWKQERQDNKTDRLQSFVDLGCGNGLLVYILSSEGHPGWGIDLRKRGIWDIYPKTTILKIEAITPSDSTLFPTTDWLIGNHSDELSPWIPVLAARSSYTTRYFLLPCCAYEFDGNKYQRQSAKLSQYFDFMNYIETISIKCGFRQTLIDRLKIPSTKRTCIIAGLTGRTYLINDFQEKCNEIQEFIDSRTKSQCKNVEKSWTNTFTPRSNVEAVKNCTKIDETIQKNIVKCVWEYLLTKRRYDDDFCRPTWNMGGIAGLSDLVKLIPIDSLKMLKTECGGLQTLLRNNHQLFMVEKGTVQIRRPISYQERLQNKEKQQNGRGGGGVNGREKDFIFKQKPCWFLENHPDGCPFIADDCSFKH